MSFLSWVKGDKEGYEADSPLTCALCLSGVEVWDYDDLVSASEGDCSYLVNAFDWSSSPQGQMYWDARYERRSLLSTADLEFLRRLVRECDERGFEE